MILRPGQDLWFVAADHRRGRDYGEYAVRVAKVGRKWAELESNAGRVNIETGWLDGGQYASPGRCWYCKEEWRTEKHRRELWADFHRRLSYSPPDGATIETIEKVKKLLGYD